MSGRPNKRPVAVCGEELEPVTLETRPKPKSLSSQTEANVLLWSLRALNYCQQTSNLFSASKGRRNNPGFEEIMTACSALEIPEWVGNLSDLASNAPMLIKQIHSDGLPPSACELSISAMMERCSMTRAERGLLLFSITIREHELLESVFDQCYRKVTTGRLFKVLAFVLGESVADIQNALRADGFLAKAGMLTLDTGPMLCFEGRFDVGFGLVEALEVANGDWNKIVNRVCAQARSSDLVESDFAHMSSEWSLVLGYIKGAALTNRIGANVLLFGPPGCGKTEFSRAIIDASGLNGFELFSEQPDGRSISAAGRRSYYRQANLYLDKEPASVLLIDEMDGMLEINEFSRGTRDRDAGWSKASANAQLESNHVPSIWITNNPSLLDPAQLRRFDLVVQFSQLTRGAIRSQLSDKLSAYGVTSNWMGTASAAKGVTPGVVKTLSLVAESIKQSSVENIDMEDMLNTVLRQRGIKVMRKPTKKYHIEYCNASMPSEALTKTLTAKEDARCLLHGTTGTGKTAFARHIAETLNLEPHLVRPSDILDSFVGGTERNIAALFQSAVPEETLIILDEFESFAADRKGADRNWMVSQVNELLTQLEAYEGRVVACTNLVDYIDPAIRRRFQLKVELLPLNAQQRLNLFKSSCQKLGLNAGDDSALYPRMGGWEQLAYGHFTNAVEIAENLSDLTLEGFAKLLEQEVASTNRPVSRPIGFLQ